MLPYSEMKKNVGRCRECYKDLSNTVTITLSDTQGKFRGGNTITAAEALSAVKTLKATMKSDLNVMFHMINKRALLVEV